MLEMARFEGTFDFQLVIDPSLDAEAIEIPSLLIQPYVENAILHGLYNKKERGILTIKISKADDHLVFEITDNGIGREAALKLNQKKMQGHQSMGLKLTEERLKLISNSPLTVFEIEDLADQNGSSGTRVKIRIALAN
jgi:sensor histidine kinase YesM